MRSKTIYYGWANLAMAALAMVATLPGRTQGLGLSTEPLISDLHVDIRVRLAGRRHAVALGAAREVTQAIGAALQVVRARRRDRKSVV